MRPCRAKHEVGFLSERPRAEQEYHHQRMREPHLGSIDGAIARALDDGEEVAVRGVEDYAVEGFLKGWDGVSQFVASRAGEGESKRWQS
jgi:hypothetical protein